MSTFFASVAFEHRVVKDECRIPIVGGQLLKVLNGFTAQRQQEFLPRVPAMIQESVKGILYREGLAFIALQQAEPVF